MPPLLVVPPLMTISSTLYVGAGADGSYAGFAKLKPLPDAVGGGLCCNFNTPY